MSKKRFSPYINILVLGIDFLFLLLLFFFFVLLQYKGFGLTYTALIKIVLSHHRESFLILLSWLLLSGYTRIYKDIRFLRFIDLLKCTLYQFISFSIVILAILGGEKENFYSYKESIFFLLILILYLIFSRLLIHSGLKFYRKKGFNLRNVIIIGNNDNSMNLVELINNRKDFGLNIVDIFTDNNIISNLESSIELNDFKKLLLTNNIEYAYISLESNIERNIINQIIEILEKHYISIRFIPSTSLETKQSLEVSYLDSFPILTYKKYPLDNSFNQIIKRMFDLVFTFFVFVFILSWVYPIISLLVLIYQGRPIHFFQKRNGLNGKEFNCLKFRSMREDKLNSLKPTERDDPRVTKLGRILRKTSLDELPQFINVLKGEMSIVGPRPHMVSENESYSDIIKRYSLRHYVKPGITGLAQTRGYRGAVDSDKDMEMRIRTDIYYVRNWSFLLDILIIFRTVKLMIFGDENAI